MAEAFDPVGQFDERAECRDARYPSTHQVSDLVLLKPGGPDVVDLFDAERNAPRALVDLQHLGFDDVALLVNLGGILDSPGPGNVADVNEPVESFLNFQKGAEFGEIAD